ncbi:MAG TPA: hypothetical protein VGA49_02990 [Patescibacteria group bacterium]
MLEQLFGSKTRTRLLKLFLDNPAKVYFVRELTRVTKTQINSIRRELKNLSDLGILKVVETTLPDAKNKKNTRRPPGRKSGIKAKKFYQVNYGFVLLPELKSIFSKSALLIERDVAYKLRNVGKINYLVLTGFFTGQKDLATDMLVVGNVNAIKIKKVVDSIQKDIRREINYTILSADEFSDRKDIGDRFIFDILLNRNIVVIDNLKPPTKKDQPTDEKLKF